jgi:broad specificity phosphatase PhoE
VLGRALRALASIRQETPSGIGVAATHGGLISILRWHLGDEFSVEDALQESMPAVYPVVWQDDTWRLAATEYP